MAVTTNTGYTYADGGMSHSLAVKADGTVLVWGSNRSYQLGLGTDVADRVRPTELPGISAVSVAAGYDFSVALTKDGAVYTWGFGQDATPVMADIAGVAAVDAGQTVILALMADGTVWQWNYGETPREVPGLDHIAAVSAGGGHCLALTTNGEVYAWGNNNAGQLGDGTMENRAEPVKIQGLMNISDISAGVSHSLAAAFSGEVYAWGSDNFGQLGDGNTQNSAVPVAVQRTNDAVQVAAGNNNSMVLTRGGQVLTWGYGEYGQLGNGSLTNAQRLPTGASKLNKDVIYIGAGVYHAFAVNSSGNLYLWGRNTGNQLGTGEETNSTEPARVAEAVAGQGGYSVDVLKGMNNWARPGMQELYQSGLVPPMLWGDYQEHITRAEFACMLVSLYEKARNNTVSVVTTSKFTDASGHPLEKEIYKAINLGILSGTTSDLVSPDRTITRQEATKMLCSFVAKMQNLTVPIGSPSLPFYNDADRIAKWAAPYVNFAYQNNIMKGGNDGSFSPEANLTVQESLVILNRLVEKYAWYK